MTNTLSFPGLGITVELNRVAFSIGDFPIYWYGITFALAFLVGVAYFYRHSRQVGIHPDDGFDILLCAVVGGVIGARAYYVIFQWDAMYKDDPMKIFAFREGGLAIYGGVIGAILVGALVSWLKKVPLIPMLDVCLPALLMGQGIGRWGNFFNIEAFGSNTTLPWGMTSPVIEEYLSRPVWWRNWPSWAKQWILRCRSTQPSFMSLCGTPWAFCCWLMFSHPGGSTTVRWHWDTWPGTVWAGSSSNSCAPTVW